MSNMHVEDNHQQMLFQWFAYQRIDSSNFPVPTNSKLIDFAFSVPNGGKRNAREAGRLKAQGTKAGVSDIVIMLPNKNYSALFVEMKRPMVKGKPKPVLSKMQKVWMDRMNSTGVYLAIVAYGYDDAKHKIEIYLGDL